MLITGVQPPGQAASPVFQDGLNESNLFFSLPVTAYTSRVSDLEPPHTFPGTLSSRPTSLP